MIIIWMEGSEGVHLDRCGRKRWRGKRHGGIAVPIHIRIGGMAPFLFARNRSFPTMYSSRRGLYHGMSLGRILRHDTVMLRLQVGNLDFEGLDACFQL